MNLLEHGSSGFSPWAFQVRIESNRGLSQSLKKVIWAKQPIDTPGDNSIRHNRKFYMICTMFSQELGGNIDWMSLIKFDVHWIWLVHRHVDRIGTIWFVQLGRIESSYYFLCSYLGCFDSQKLYTYLRFNESNSNKNDSWISTWKLNKLTTWLLFLFLIF